MSKPTRRKLMRRYGATDKDGKPIVVEAAKRQSVPIKFKGTQLIVRVVEGQIINPEKEYMRQLGISPKRWKKMRNKKKKLLRDNANQDA